MPGRAPSVVVDPELKEFHCQSFYPDRSLYPKRPSEAVENAFDVFALRKRGEDLPSASGLTLTIDDDRPVAKSLSAVGAVVLALVCAMFFAFLIINESVFWNIAMFSHWLLSLVWIFLGLPVLAALMTLLVRELCKLDAASKVPLLCGASSTTLHDVGKHSFLIAMFGWLFFLAVGIPYTMYNGQLRAIHNYQNPNMTQDVSCYVKPQQRYEHGKLHFVFLQERNWEFNCSSTGFSPSGRIVDRTPKRAQMGSEGSDFFYMTNLFYVGKPEWNCPYPIFTVCYKNTGLTFSCEQLLKDTTCWAASPLGLPLRVLNQNEQFFRNWIADNDIDAEAFIRSRLLAGMHNAPWRDSGPIVTYGGDHPADFDDKEESVEASLLEVKVCMYLLWPLFVVLWLHDVKCSRLLGCLTCECL